MSSDLHVGLLLGDPRLPYDYAPGGRFGSQELEAHAAVERALGGLSGIRVTVFDDHDVLLDALPAAKPDLVLNLCDVGYRNRWELELNLPAFLELHGIPYTGADPRAIVLSNDKAVMSTAARLANVPVPDETLLDPRADGWTLPSRYPVIIKPNVASGSVGITERSFARDAGEAETTLRALRDEGAVREVLVQEFLPGAELTVGLIGNPGQGFRVLPPLEVDYAELDDGLPPILTHGSKADPSSPYWSRVAFRQATLSDDDRQHLGAAAGAVFERLGFRDYARFDFRAGADGAYRLIDANVNPTWYEGGKMAVMAGWDGIDYPGMLRAIIDAAAARVGLPPTSGR